VSVTYMIRWFDRGISLGVAAMSKWLSTQGTE